MLGGPEDDDVDLDNLLEDCNVLGAATLRGPRNDARDSLGSGVHGEEDLGSGTPQVGSSSGANGNFAEAIQALIQHSKDLVNVVKEGKKNDDYGSSKRKLREEICYYPQDPVMILEPNYNLKDDAHDTLDLKLMQRLRPINACPFTYYKKGAFERVERPIHGRGLFTEHLMPASVHEGTVCRMHDREAHWEIKNLLTRNSGVQRELRKQVKVDVVQSDEFSMGVQTQWNSANYVWEIVEAGFNYMAVEHMIRTYSYTALAMMRTLHECRYFCGCTNNPKVQRGLIETFFNDCFQVLSLNGENIDRLC